ncbi:GNAT family N-acetyltransferase [Anaeromyxobacter sp. SG64]|uniref:GNAT family N-acetyltransferase n=1 Tax=Anaeromyxobacter sp. SG64 TaxID=2925409 RepID=UPI001F5A7D7C|nr:GNAT family N-acetyltransferase [Anaeromyxobacter sp. SG64]
MSRGRGLAGRSSRPRAPRAATLRAASLDDATAVARVMRSAVRGRGAAAYSDAELRAWASLPALYHRWAMAAGGERYVVAERDGLVVGYAARRGTELTAVFVLPRAAGRGLGSALVQHAARAARRAGATRLRVLAALGAVPFYERLGFARRGDLRVPLPGGASLAAIRMEKRLDGPDGRAGKREPKPGKRPSDRTRARPRGR